MNSRYVRQNSKPAWYIIMPNSKFKTAWNMVIIALLAYTSTVVPFQVAFVDIDSFGTVIFNYIVDFLFAVDIIINFFSAYELANARIEIKLRTIGINYLSGWFFLDVLATFPTQIFTSGLEGGTGSNKLLRLMRLPRLYRLARLMRIFKILKMFKYNKKFNEWFGALKLQASHQKMLTLLLFGAFLIHLFACFWYLTAKFEEFGPGTWVARKGLLGLSDFSSMYTATVQQYVESTYWALQVLTTIGFGDFGAGTKAEYVVNLFWMFLGVAYYQVVFGQIISIMTAHTSNETILTVSNAKSDLI